MTDDLVRFTVLVIAVAVLVPIVAMAIFAPMGMTWHGGTGWHDDAHMYGDAHMGGAWVAWILTLVLVGAVGYVIYRSVSTEDEDEAIQELRRAYARGDLTDEEFEKRRETLANEK